VRIPPDPALLRAFCETDYHVHADPPFVLRIGEPSPLLLALHRARGVEASVYVTACNPWSQQLSEADNCVRTDGLRLRLRREGLAFVEGVGQHPGNGWPGEVSFLVLGVGCEAARRLGEDLQQHAIVVAASDAVPHLLLVSADPSHGADTP
jgi:hypothetical protein